MDPRSHVRGDSIAYQRNTPKKEFRTTYSSPRKPSQPTNDAFSSMRNQQIRRLAIRGGLAATGILLLVYFLSSSGSSGRVDHAISARKARLAGAGESHVIPKRWRDHDSGGVKIKGENLDFCKRVLLYRFGDSTHLASEMHSVATAGAIANKLGYTLLLDDQFWNFGSLQNFFVPRTIFCRPPADWFLTESAVALGSKRWQRADRIWFSAELAGKANNWIREELLDHDAVRNELRDRKLGPIVPEGESLPATLEEVFQDYSSVLREIWRPNDQLSVLIRKQRMEFGLGSGGIRARKNSPTWGGRKQPSENDRIPVEQVENEEDHDFEEAGGARRNDRGPVIGLFASAPPSSEFLRSFGISKLNKASLWSPTLDALRDAVRRLSKSSIASPSYSRSQPSIFPSAANSSVILISLDSAVAAQIVNGEIGTKFKVQRTEIGNDEENLRWQEYLKSGDGLMITKNWNLAAWNRLPKGLRIHLTRYFIRDVTTLALYADAFVLSGATDVTRLILLLGGTDSVVGPREISGKGLGGRIRSVDSWWYPTSSLEAMW